MGGPETGVRQYRNLRNNERFPGLSEEQTAALDRAVSKLIEECRSQGGRDPDGEPGGAGDAARPAAGEEDDRREGAAGAAAGGSTKSQRAGQEDRIDPGAGQRIGASRFRDERGGLLVRHFFDVLSHAAQFPKWRRRAVSPVTGVPPCRSSTPRQPRCFDRRRCVPTRRRNSRCFPAPALAPGPVPDRDGGAGRGPELVHGGRQRQPLFRPD